MFTVFFGCVVWMYVTACVGVCVLLLCSVPVQSSALLGRRAGSAGFGT